MREHQTTVSRVMSNQKFLYAAQQSTSLHFVDHHVCSLLGVPVNGGYYSSSGWDGGLLLGLLSQVLAYIRGGVGAFQLGLLTLPFTIGIRPCWLRWFLLDCGWCGGWGLGNRDLGRVQVDPIGWGMVVSVCPSHCVEELVKNMEKDTQK